MDSAGTVEQRQMQAHVQARDLQEFFGEQSASVRKLLTTVPNSFFQSWMPLTEEYFSYIPPDLSRTMWFGRVPQNYIQSLGGLSKFETTGMRIAEERSFDKGAQAIEARITVRVYIPKDRKHDEPCNRFIIQTFSIMVFDGNGTVTKATKWVEQQSFNAPNGLATRLEVNPFNALEDIPENWASADPDYIQAYIAWLKQSFTTLRIEIEEGIFKAAQTAFGQEWVALLRAFASESTFSRERFGYAHNLEMELAVYWSALRAIPERLLATKGAGMKSKTIAEVRENIEALLARPIPKIRHGGLVDRPT